MCPGGGRAGTCGTWSSWGAASALTLLAASARAGAARLLLRLVAGGVQLRGVLVHRLGSGRVGSIRHRLRRDLDLGLDRGLRTPFGGRRLRVGARPLDVVLIPGTTARRPAAAPTRPPALDG